YRTYFTRGLTRTLVAAKAQEASTKTGGDIFIQLLFNMADPSIDVDRVLDGPTNDRWIDPWLAYLRSRGVDYRFDCRLEGFEISGGKIAGAWIRQGEERRLVEGDYYVAAVPVEVLAPLLTDEILKLDSSLATINALKADVSWMNGLQIYLNEPVDINRGHVIYADSQWALTSISQPQFWKDFDPSRYGGGNVKDILSVDISDWDTPGLNGKAAKDCVDNQDVFDEVWSQLKASLNVDGRVRLRDEQIVTWYLDDDIRFFSKHTQDTEPLLVNKVNTWDLRPDAHTGIPNLFLASDYVKTYTDLATMEGANEAARRAVNGIIDASGSPAPLCRLWQIHEPWSLSLLRWLDGRRFRDGLPWRDEFPELARVAHAAMVWASSIISRQPWKLPFS
ncbi:MAG: FAD-dependent oxidoreductase, partial [Rhodothermales bacterium]